MLERNGGEVARATSIVRYAPGSAFSPHIHRGGEEFLVLDGVFVDELGEYPAGTYVRNPVGSSHTPSSPEGCVILVKLWQMPADDQRHVRIDTRTADGWRACETGCRLLTLHRTAHETVCMVELAAGHTRPESSYRGGAELFLVEGDLGDERDDYPTGSWLRLPPGMQHRLRSHAGARYYLKTEHLASPPPLPGP